MGESVAAGEQWDGVAGAWDAQTDYVERHTLEMTEAMVRAVDVRAGDRVLELAAGPGAMGATWSQLVGPSGHVLLSDISPAMVEAAERRCASHDNVDVALVDAAAIDLPDGSVDVVVCRMGLMFTPTPDVAFGEIRRVLGDGGRFAALTWAGIEHNPWLTCVGMSAMMHGVVTGGPPVGPGGIFSLGDPDLLRTLATDAGLVDVTVAEFPVRFHADTIDDHFDHVRALAGPLAVALAAASPDQLDKVRASAADLAAQYITEDGVAMPGLALLVTGRVGPSAAFTVA